MSETTVEVAKRKGGPHPGAGRPKGVPDRKRQDFAFEAVRRHVTPVEMLLILMEEAKARSDRHYLRLEEVISEKKVDDAVFELRQAERNEIAARGYAIDASVFIHPKMPTAIIASSASQSELTETDESVLRRYLNAVAIVNDITASAGTEVERRSEEAGTDALPD